MASEKTRTRIPYVESKQNAHRLMVHGKPFLILGAELQNSSFSCLDYMGPIWQRLKDMHVNTVLASVTWEMIEPREGTFDFNHLDHAIANARHHGLCLILLWFGAFKNAKSTYAPEWVKLNPSRFPRARMRIAAGKKRPTDAISIFDSDIVMADAAAFKTLMRHVREIDEQHSTVIMVQVENEVGFLGDTRDTSSAADAQFQTAVPASLQTMLSETWQRLHPSLHKNLEHFQNHKQQGGQLSWSDLFGQTAQTDELFMAYHFALYVDQVAQAGQTEYPLPMFTNVWQNYADEDADRSLPTSAGGKPGDYPSGGGVINVLDIWQHFAPSLSFIAPDIYLNDYESVCAKYRHRDQALFIPEQRRDEYGARRIWSAYGTYHALCTAPFGVDTLNEKRSPWRKHYELLGQVSEYILEAQAGSCASFGFFFDEPAASLFDEPGASGELRNMFRHTMGKWHLEITRAFVFGKPGPGYGMIIQRGSSRFLLVGEGFEVRFRSTDPQSSFSGILRFVERAPSNMGRRLRHGRVLNGDETRNGEAAIMPSEHPDYGDHPISTTIPAKTRIAEVEVYSLTQD